MKKTLIYLFCAALPMVLTAQKKTQLSNPKATKEAKALYAYLQSVYGKKILSGQMWASWGYDELKYINEVTGKQPAIRGMDFINARDNENEVKFAIDWWKTGGIPTIMWHMGAPGIGEGYENSKKPIDIDKVFEKGTVEYEAFWKELKEKGDLLERIKAANVPILWRPYHELNGNWFWWGKQGPEKFKRLWITMYNYYTKERKLDNLIWVLCYTGNPDGAWYPGDQYVDIAGADTYAKTNDPQTSMYNKVKDIVGTRVPIAFHECGIPPDPEKCLKENSMWSWWMEWHTSHLKNLDKEYLKYIYNHDLVITKDEVPDIMGGSKETVKTYEAKSPDGNITVIVEAGNKLQWSVQHKGDRIIVPSTISLQLEDGTILGDKAVISSAPVKKVNAVINAINYKKSLINDQYNELTLNCKGDYGVIFRVYDDAVAYRFFTKKKGEVIVKNEEANFNFTNDYPSYIPIQWDYRDGQNFNSSFEALYHEIKLSQFPKDSLAFLPLLVQAGAKKVVVLEADLEDYPGMYLDLNSTGKGLKGVYAPYPVEAHTVASNYIPTKRADYIAKTTGTRNFPWRAVVISEQDKELLNQDIVQKLASPNRLQDISWIKTGLVSWDWWNARNISGVDFKAGLNTPTYKYFIDFAAANKIPYIIIDGGWSDRFDLFKVNPNLNLQEIIDYGKGKGVGVILWANWYAIVLQMDKAFPEYSKMGVKGWKIDYVDRDDQVAVASLYEIAKKAAENKLLVDYHGAFKPTGLQRTYPNVIGYEGVKGLENYKWANEDQPKYTTIIPFIRMMAGPMDYTPGAMRNATEATYRVVGSNPMSKGTRCNQLAQYVIFEAPLQMLSDNPTIYKKEQLCTDFITNVPTTFDETVALDSKIGEYVAIARRKGDAWFVGAMSNWTPHDITLDLSFLPEGNYEAEIFKDGMNADRDATDYKREIISVSKSSRQAIKLYPGGGWAARIYKKPG